MSEPLSSHEIEDVLSSIRRLVSEDLRPGLRQTGPAVPAEAAALAPGRGEKLVLTQALRVVPTEPALAEPAPVVGETAGDAGPAAAFAAPEEFYDDTGMEEGEGPSAAFFAAGAFAGAPEEDATDDEPAAAAEEPAAAESARRGHWTAETVPEVTWMQADEDWIEEEPVPFAAHPRAGDAVTGDPLARAWAERAEAEVRAELQEAHLRATAPPPPPQGPRIDPAGASGPGLFDHDDPVIDEEMLRDIVREIIREELAGTLGERITRNVRKLVRVEINRALTAREFE